MHEPHLLSPVRRSLETPISRRRALQIAGAAGAAAFLGGTTASPAVAQDPGKIPGSFRMASWIGYMDTDGAAPHSRHSSASRPRQASRSITRRPSTATRSSSPRSCRARSRLVAVPAGTSSSLTDWMTQRLVNLGWLEPLDVAVMPNYAANLEDVYRTRPWDPGNLLAAPLHSGMTGIGYDGMVTGELTDLDILFAQDYAGRLTFLDDMHDTVGLAAIRRGVRPEDITQEQFDAALADVRTTVESGIVQRITGNDYVQDMANGDVVVAMAWSGDVLSLLVPAQGDGQDFQWRLPEQGGMLWTDNMSIPKGAESKAQAQVFIDWYYVPANAAQVEAFVNYVCPVKGAAEAIMAIDPALATNTLIFPDEAMRARLHQFRSVDIDTAAAWETAFNEVAGL